MMERLRVGPFASTPNPLKRHRFHLLLRIFTSSCLVSVDVILYDAQIDNCQCPHKAVQRTRDTQRKLQKFIHF